MNNRDEIKNRNITTGGSDEVSGRGRRLLVGLLLCATLSSTSCRTASNEVVARPTRHSVRSDQLLILSDFKLPKGHPLVAELITLRKQVSQTLQLTFQQQEVVVYIFSSETEYREYLNSTYPGLPERRAYFVGTPQELAVYTFWGSRIQEDLRHEYTHGLLHAALKQVPLWLDEGLAEYFEITGPRPGTVNAEYSNRLRTMVANSWNPDLKRLERIEEFSQMQRVDYQEAWAWVHFMLHSSPESKDVLLGYLHDLREDGNPALLSGRLQRELPQVEPRFLSYLASLHVSQVMQTNGEQPQGTADSPKADRWWTIHQ